MRPDTDSTALWRDAVRAAEAFAIGAGRLRGMRILGPAGPVRDMYLRVVRALLGDSFSERRLPASATEAVLLGGADLAASLEAKRLVQTKGLLTQDVPVLLVVPVAERLSKAIVGILARALDQPARAPLICIALDEGFDADTAVAPALTEHLGPTVDLRPIIRVPSDVPVNGRNALREAHAALARVDAPEAAIEALCAGSLALGIVSLRAPLQAVTLARASAALDGRSSVASEDVAFAARFVLGPHATAVPASPQAMPEPPAEDDSEHPAPQACGGDDGSFSPAPSQETSDLEDLVIEAAQAALPAGLLSTCVGRSQPGKRRQGKSGASRKGGRRGRPLASRPGTPAQGPFDLLATLKAAVPWQRLRTRDRWRSSGIAFRRGDIHIRRYRERSESLTIFAVDASGSTAAQRLAEAKGAVELLLADCYVRRDQVALIAFRKSAAEIVLPPTRSLVRAKRLLAEMPSGGGTPLGLAIAAATDLAESAMRSGLSPTVVFLTDGGANTTRDGGADRARAESEARLAARRAASLGVRMLLIDVSRRDRPFAREISSLLNARYVKLPRSDATSLAMAVGLQGSQ